MQLLYKLAFALTFGIITSLSITYIFYNAWPFILSAEFNFLPRIYSPNSVSPSAGLGLVAWFYISTLLSFLITFSFFSVFGYRLAVCFQKDSYRGLKKDAVIYLAILIGVHVVLLFFPFFLLFL